MNAHEIHETHEKMEEAHAGHGHGHGHDGRGRKVAILISILAALLAIVEMGGKSAQTTALTANIESSDLWSFYQAKTIRGGLAAAQADLLELLAPDGLPADRATAVAKRIAGWRDAAKHEDSEPATQNGRKELMARARAAEEQRDHAMHAYHLYEYASGALEIGIVLASAAVVTGVFALAWAAAGIGLVGMAFAAMAWAPALTVIGGGH